MAEKDGAYAPPPFLHQHQRAMNQLFTSTSRVLSALLFVAVTTESAAQSFPLPYNPDENGDGLIGVVDLQGLLANYGSEFSSAVLSEDGESAITYMGEMAYPPCAMACKNLPGMWTIPTLEQLGLVWEEVNANTFGVNADTWLIPSQGAGDVNINGGDRAFTLRVYNRNGYQYGSAHAGGTAKCYCAARQLPRVEFYKCVGNGSNAVEECVTCTNTKLAEGWQLLPPGGSSIVQDLWRWAE